MSDNVYLDNMCYTEVAIAIEDFHYEDYVKCVIPSLCVNSPNLNFNENSKKINSSNIMNKDLSTLNISTYNITNYVEIYIPLLYMDKDDWDKGKKGTKFLVTFAGGNQSNYNVIGRCYN